MTGFRFLLHIKVTSITVGDVRRKRIREDGRGTDMGEVKLCSVGRKSRVRRFLGFVHSSF
jgi:hypothetical protein